MNFQQLVVAAAALAASAAQAGVYIESVERDVRSGTQQPAQTMYVQGGAARIEPASSGEATDLVIFKDDVLYIVEAASKSYIAMDRETVRMMAGKMNSAMEQARAQMAQLPPEQRAMMEQMIGKLGQGMPGASTSRPVLATRDSGRSETVAGRKCRVWELTRDAAVEQQLCVVPFSEVPGNEDLLALSQRMAALMKEFVDAFGEVAPSASDVEVMGSVNGYPILMRDFEAGKPSGEEVLLKQWRAQDIPAAMFEVPAGYTRRDIREEMERGR